MDGLRGADTHTIERFGQKTDHAGYSQLLVESTAFSVPCRFIFFRCFSHETVFLLRFISKRLYTEGIPFWDVRLKNKSSTRFL